MLSLSLIKFALTALCLNCRVIIIVRLNASIKRKNVPRVLVKSLKNSNSAVFIRVLLVVLFIKLLRVYHLVPWALAHLFRFRHPALLIKMAVKLRWLFKQRVISM